MEDLREASSEQLLECIKVVNGWLWEIVDMEKAGEWVGRESEAELKSTRTLQIKKWMSKQYARTLIKESLQRARARLGEDYQEQGQEQEQEQDQEHDALAREVSQNYQEMIRSQEESVQKATARFQQDSREMSRSSKAQDLQEEEQKLNVQDRGYTMFGLACLMNHTQTPASMRAAQAYRNIRKREEAAGRWNSLTVKNCKKAEISQQWKRRKICKLILELQEEQQDPALLKKKEMLRRHFEAEEPDQDFWEEAEEEDQSFWEGEEQEQEQDPEQEQEQDLQEQEQEQDPTQEQEQDLQEQEQEQEHQQVKQEPKESELAIQTDPYLESINVEMEEIGIREETQAGRGSGEDLH